MSLEDPPWGDHSRAKNLNGSTPGSLSQLQRGQFACDVWECESSGWGQRFAAMLATVKQQWENVDCYDCLLAVWLFIVWGGQRQSKKTCKEIMAIIQTRGNGGLDLDGGSGHRGKWPDSWYILKITLTGHAKIWGLFVRRADDNCYFKDLRNTVSTFLSNFNSYLDRLLKCGKKKKRRKRKVPRFEQGRDWVQIVALSLIMVMIWYKSHNLSLSLFLYLYSGDNNTYFPGFSWDPMIL